MSKESDKIILTLAEKIIDLQRIKELENYEDSNEYEKLKTQIANKIWEFYANKCNEQGNEDECFYDKVPEKIEYFVKKYSVGEDIPEKDRFHKVRNYVSRVLSNDIKKRSALSTIKKKYGGIVSKETDVENIRKIIRYAKGYGLNLNDADDCSRLHELTKISLKKINLILGMQNLKVDSLIKENHEGDVYTCEATDSLNKEYCAENEVSYKKIFDAFNEAYDKTQERHPLTKKFLSKVISYKLLKQIEKIETSRRMIADILKNYAFVDWELLNMWEGEEDFPSQESLARAAPFNKDKTEFSRVWKNFKKKLPFDFGDKFNDGD